MNNAPYRKLSFKLIILMETKNCPLQLNNLIIPENIQYNFSMVKKKVIYLRKLFIDFFYSALPAEKFL